MYSIINLLPTVCVLMVPPRLTSRSSHHGAINTLPAEFDVDGKATFVTATSPVVDPNTIAPLAPTLAVVYVTPLSVNEGIVILCSVSSPTVPTDAPVVLISTNATPLFGFME